MKLRLKVGRWPPNRHTASWVWSQSRTGNAESWFLSPTSQPLLCYRVVSPIQGWTRVSTNDLWFARILEAPLSPVALAWVQASKLETPSLPISLSIRGRFVLNVREAVTPTGFDQGDRWCHPTGYPKAKGVPGLVYSVVPYKISVDSLRLSNPPSSAYRFSSLPDYKMTTTVQGITSRHDNVTSEKISHFLPGIFFSSVEDHFPKVSQQNSLLSLVKIRYIPLSEPMTGKCNEITIIGLNLLGFTLRSCGEGQTPRQTQSSASKEEVNGSGQVLNSICHILSSSSEEYRVQNMDFGDITVKFKPSLGCLLPMWPQAS